jgi:hypothetical protein
VEEKMTEKVPFWKRDGFKRGVGVFLMAMGEALKTQWPEIGNIVIWIGGIIGGIGIAAAAIKK